MTEKDAKKYTLIFMAATILIAPLGMLISYALDPFQVFHKSWFTSDRYVVNAERFQNAGLINRFLPSDECCEILVLGTSHSQNFLPSTVQKFFKGNGVLQLTIAGSIISEQALMLRKAAESGEIRTVIWDIHDPLNNTDHAQPVNDAEMLKSSPEKFMPEFLYDDKKWNDIFLLASADVLMRFYSHLYGKPYETFHSWYEKAKGSFGKGKEIGLNNIAFVRKDVPTDHGRYTYANMGKFILPAIEAHPDQQFYIFFPPYSRHFYATMKKLEFDQLMAMRFQLTNALEKYPNVKLFAFDDYRVTENLDSYRDPAHYNMETSNQLLHDMVNNKGRLRASNVQKNIRDLTNSSNTYAVKFMKKYCSSPCATPQNTESSR